MHIFSVVRLVSLPEVGVNAKLVGTAHLLLVVSLQLQLHFYSFYSVDKTATIQMIVRPGIVSGSWKHPTVWLSQQKKRR